MERAVVGGDPGSSGSVCILSSSRRHYTFKFSLGTWNKAYLTALSWHINFEIVKILFERVGGRAQETKMTKPTIFTFGENTGRMKALFEFQGYKHFDYVEPSAWQQYNGVAGRVAPLTATDKQDYDARKELYRATAEKLLGRPVTLSEGDSILIARMAWEQTFGVKW